MVAGLWGADLPSRSKEYREAQHLQTLACLGLRRARGCGHRISPCQSVVARSGARLTAVRVEDFDQQRIRAPGKYQVTLIVENAHEGDGIPAMSGVDLKAPIGQVLKAVELLAVQANRAAIDC